VILPPLVFPVGAMLSGLYYKHVTIINYASSGINKLKASLNDDARVVIYDRHMFIVQATGHFPTLLCRSGGSQ
jgi:hypothetical protein